MSDSIRHSATLAVRCAPEILERVAEASAAKLTKPSEYVRRAVLDRLEADGVSLRPAAA
jgi:hypothetical protein